MSLSVTSLNVVSLTNEASAVYPAGKGPADVPEVPKALALMLVPGCA